MNEKLNRQILNVLELTGASTADQLHECLKQSRKATMDALETLEHIGAITREFDAGLNCSVFSLPTKTPTAEPAPAKAPQKQSLSQATAQTDKPKRNRPSKVSAPISAIETDSVQEPVPDCVYQKTDAIDVDNLPDVQPQPAKNAVITVKKVRNKPFTPNPTRGYEAKHGYVKIFLERRACSRTLTLTVDDLKELLRAAEKAA
ncbi:hypothetical protein [Vitreoscilla stercoraria]|uniref:Uncharacterized protein n=1 Tax=Vitreoscilla stercoraria TaxID=61 RepID=A0ABY4EDH8_VITST|nr:hypothetical protein [Vitreoscilla stercoraria]UOO93351.1 hypothetical protein LVJ81_04805 [Vitreoscilla stercoraria]